MQNSMGIESSVLVRENSMAVRADLAFESASASTMPSARFWFGQMTNQTLNHMIVPSHMPMPIAVLLPSSMKPIAMASTR